GRVSHVLVPLMRTHTKRSCRPGLVGGNTDSKKGGRICALKSTQMTSCISNRDGCCESPLGTRLACFCQQCVRCFQTDGRGFNYFVCHMRALFSVRFSFWR